MRIQLLIGIAILTTACETSPIVPTIIPAPIPAAAPTALPGVWDSRDELVPWTQNSSVAGAATVVGDGTDAVIRIDLTQGEVRVQSPGFEPPLQGVTSGRIRYRWLDAGQDDRFWLSLWLRPPVVDSRVNIPIISPVGFDDAAFRTGAWFDDRLEMSSSTRVDVRFTTLLIGGRDYGSSATSPRHIHGTLEIDRITLVR